MKYLLSDINLFDQGNLKGFGPLGLEQGQDPGDIFNKFISNAIGLMTIIAFLWFIFLVIIGAIGIMSAGGDKNAIQTNTKKITNGLIGLVVLISAIALIQLIGKLFQIDNFILDPATAIKNLTF